MFPYVVQPYDHYWRSDQVTPAHLMTKNSSMCKQGEG